MAGRLDVVRTYWPRACRCASSRTGRRRRSVCGGETCAGAAVRPRGARTGDAGNLGALSARPTGQQLLAAVAWARSSWAPIPALQYTRWAEIRCGKVELAAVPTSMVKAIGEQHHVPMPSFFGYTL